MEIYCERVRDLLDPKSKGNLRVRCVHMHVYAELGVTSYMCISNVAITSNIRYK